MQSMGSLAAAFVFIAVDLAVQDLLAVEVDLVEANHVAVESVAQNLLAAS